MSENMVERVARAIAKTQGFDDYSSDMYRHMARAAIKEMREPTPAMVEAGVYSENTLEAIAGQPYSDSCQNIWRAMIDAALSEPQT